MCQKMKQKIIGSETIIHESEDLPFVMQVSENSKLLIAQNPRDQGILIGTPAMIAAGAQSEFIAANILQAHSLNCAVILRAGAPPQYNKHRSPKSGLNLSKTSNQGFFKGSLSAELRFGRLDSKGEAQAHAPKDALHLKLVPTDPDYQHTMPLDININDIIRELRPEGDLMVLGYNEESGLLRMAYKYGHGPKTDTSDPHHFNGQFVINLKDGEDIPQFYSREWDKAEHDPDWNHEKQVIKKPSQLEAIPDELYEKIFKHTFKLGYTESKSETVCAEDILSAKVFADRPRNAQDFKAAMGESHPSYMQIKNCDSFSQILDTLKTIFTPDRANDLIREVYNKSGSIISGDWDGMLLGHPKDLQPKFAVVFNTFASGIDGLENQENLLTESDNYLNEIKLIAKIKKAQGRSISAFEEQVLFIPSITEIVSDFSLARAGCITPYEFVFQQVLNYAYRDQLNTHYGEKYDLCALQKVMDKLISIKETIPKDKLRERVLQMIKDELLLVGTTISELMLNSLSEHVINHMPLAEKETSYLLPHLQHDMNLQDLYQHGFDMRNPYGCNLEGAWLLISEDGGVLYGKTQEQLIEVLLTGDFLKKNHINVNPAAAMSLGWDRVIEKQILLNQSIPPETLAIYEQYIDSKTIRNFQNIKPQLLQLDEKEDTSLDSSKIQPS